MNNYPTGVTVHDFVDPQITEPTQAELDDAAVEKVISKYLDDGDSQSHLIELLQSMRDGDPEQQNMAVTGLMGDLRAFVQRRGYYCKRAR